MASFLYIEITGHNRWAHIVDHKVHDGLRHEVPYGFVYNADVRIHQVADGFNLPLQLRVHRECVCRGIFIVNLSETMYKCNLRLSGLFPEGTTGAFVHFIPGPSLDKRQPEGTMLSSCPHRPENHRPTLSDGGLYKRS